jgi:hypothetical protein
MLGFIIGVVLMAALTFWKTDWYKTIVRGVVWTLEKISDALIRAQNWLEERYL